MQLVVLCLLFFVVPHTLTDNPLKAFRDFWNLNIRYSSKWCPSIDGKHSDFDSIITLIGNGSGVINVYPRVVPSVSENATLFMTKLGTKVNFDKWSGNHIQMNIQQNATITEALDFIFDQVLDEPPKRLERLNLYLMDSEPVIDLLVARQVKADYMFTHWLDETKLLHFIKSTEAKKFSTSSLQNDSTLSDAFFNDSFILNLKKFEIVSRIVSHLTDETLLKTKAEYVGLREAPKISLAAVRRFLQPAIEGKMDYRALKLDAPFKFDEEVFLKGLKVQGLPGKRFTQEWTGIDGPPRRITYIKHNENSITLSASNVNAYFVD